MICAGLALSNVTIGGITSNHSRLTKILRIWVAFWPGRCELSGVLLRATGIDVTVLPEFVPAPPAVGLIRIFQSHRELGAA